MTKHLICAQCGVGFDLRVAEYNRQLKAGRDYFFCSRSCGAIHANSSKVAPIIKKSCPHCGSLFETRQDRHEASFCSRSCASVSSVTAYRREVARIWGLKHMGMLHSPQETLSKREMPKYAEIRPFLESKGLAHAFEYQIGRYVFDLALLERRMLIEFDGPEHRMPSGLERDAKRDAVASSAGWRVLRIPVKTGQVVPVSMLEAVL